MAKEELEQWAREKAPTLTDDHWLELERAAVGFYPNTDDWSDRILDARSWLKGELRALWYDGGQMLTPRGRALLAYRQGMTQV
jgi:hypothetical protein